MPAEWALAILATFTAPPMPLLQADPVLVEIARDASWLRPRCLAVRCGDEEWRGDRQGGIAWREKAARQPLPGARRHLPLSAPAVRRDSYAAYSNDWRIGARQGYQLVRDPDMRLGVEFGAGYRMAPLHDDGVRMPGPVFRGGIDLGRQFGERVQWTQRVRFETGNGERFVHQSLGLDVSLDDDWRLETDYVIRYDSQGASGSETAEAWFGIRREL